VLLLHHDLLPQRPQPRRAYLAPASTPGLGSVQLAGDLIELDTTEPLDRMALPTGYASFAEERSVVAWATVLSPDLSR
jgi:hypothetical protein